MDAFDDSSEEDEICYLTATGMLPGFQIHATIGKRPGSQPGKRGNIHRDFDTALKRLSTDYFGPSPRFGTASFERCFRMTRTVFDKLFHTINGDGIFWRRVNALGKPGIHPIQRVVAAIRIICYGVAADTFDEYLETSEYSVILLMKGFFEAVIAKYSEEYLREPTEKDLIRIMQINAARGFRGCVGSIDCQQWECKNCPIA